MGHENQPIRHRVHLRPSSELLCADPTPPRAGRSHEIRHPGLRPHGRQPRKRGTTVHLDTVCGVTSCQLSASAKLHEYYSQFESSTHEPAHRPAQPAPVAIPDHCREFCRTAPHVPASTNHHRKAREIEREYLSTRLCVCAEEHAVQCWPHSPTRAREIGHKQQRVRGRRKSQIQELSAFFRGTSLGFLFYLHLRTHFFDESRSTIMAKVAASILPTVTSMERVTAM